MQRQAEALFFAGITKRTGQNQLRSHYGTSTQRQNRKGKNGKGEFTRVSNLLFFSYGFGRLPKGDVAKGHE